MPVDGLLIVAEDTELASEVRDNGQPTLKISFTQKSTETEASLHDYKWAMKNTLVGWVIWGIILHSYLVILINQYKDPY